MKIYNSEGYLGIINEFDEIYQKIRNEGGFHLRIKYALYCTIYLLLFLLVLYVYFWRICVLQTEYIIFFISLCTTICIAFIVYILKINNKMYQFYDIELTSPLWFNFQTEAQNSYNQIIGNIFENEMIKEGKLFNSENDIELLNRYIKLVEEEIRTKRKESLFETQKVAIVIALLTLGCWFINLICSHYDLYILSLEFLLVIILTTISLWCVLYLLTQISKLCIDIQNRKIYRLEQVSRFLKSILIKRGIERSRQLEEYKSLNFLQKLKKRLLK
ncbi:hypothetical protein [Dysgonomonas sp. GY617]|uniref:hypothetical protein n=1 Tax=Dysgonomonas sp. GY617 TaxID=2780420 RepID=UPI0018835754|nr:hypothetical protein [Dysgonomonas sp. GY617]MBF0577588.1 hypothetical protein [Dysgonomonas sp. GY617]